VATEAVILTSPAPDAYDLNLAKLVRFLGLECKILRVEDRRLSLDYLNDSIPVESPCVMVNTSLLADLCAAGQKLDPLKSFIRSRKSFVLVYNVTPAEQQSAALADITDGLVSSVTSFAHDGYAYEVCDDNRPICRQFSGLSIDPIESKHDFGLECPKSLEPDVTELIAIDKRPYFLRLQKETSFLFLLANNHVVDPARMARYKTYACIYFSRLVPVLMFLKHVFGGQCWHRTVSQASCIIDDPLLKEPYGSLSYTRLLQVMADHNFFTNIAFIPRNYRRTKKDVARLIAARPDRYGLCVHGCDHTRREFSERDPLELNRLIHLADTRMAAHQQRTGLKFARFMLFPQAYFSKQAMMMLKANNYIGAASVAISPRDDRNRVVTSSLLDLAVMDYSSFPLLVRRYPREVLSLALDMFLGKPGLVYLHQDDFTGGYTDVIQLIEKMNAMDDTIVWAGMTDIMQSFYKQKTNGDRHTDIALYSDDCVLTNSSAFPRKYSVIKHEKGDVSLEKVTHNGEAVDVEIIDGILKLEIEIPPESELRIRAHYANRIPYIEKRKNLKKEMVIWARRRLSEFRDTRLNRILVLKLSANRLMNKFR